MPKIGRPSKKGKPRIAANGNRLPDPLPRGEVLTDVTKRKWKLGKSIGLGGFGEIYLASEDSRKQTGPDASYVIKVEDHSNGPLFAEMHFYHRVGKEEKINEWIKKKKMSFLGMPKFIGSGSHEYKSVKYRFMVMERFGDDLQKILEKNNKTFPIKTVYTLGKLILDILEYIHSHGYIHADVKASNLLTGFGPGKENEVYLIDFGLACRYVIEGKHKEFKEDLRKAHDGTIEFTSRDAHIGAHSRRGDLEILGYNMLQWLCGRLPWEDHLKDPECINRQKNMYLSNVTSLIKNCFPKSVPPSGITEYFSYVASLKFDEEPNYKHCKDILSIGIKACGLKDDGRLDYISQDVSLKRKGVKRPPARWSHSSSPPNKMKKGNQTIPSENTDLFAPPPRKIRRVASATTSLQASKSNRPPDKSFCVLDNPTPAMLLVMQRHMERKLQQQNGFSKTKTSIDKNGSKEIIKDLKLSEIMSYALKSKAVPKELIKDLIPNEAISQSVKRKTLHRELIKDLKPSEVTLCTVKRKLLHKEIPLVKDLKPSEVSPHAVKRKTLQKKLIKDIKPNEAISHAVIRKTLLKSKSSFLKININKFSNMRRTRSSS